MEKQLYIREGRRFVKIHKRRILENYEGLYYQKNKTFVKERDENSIGMCILSHNNVHTIMELEDCGNSATYTRKQAIIEVKKHFDGYGSIPTIYEFTNAIKFRDKLKISAEYYLNIFDNINTYAGGATYAGLFGFYAYSGTGYANSDIGSRLRVVVRIDNNEK